MSETQLTLEGLYNILRNEKKKLDLQRLEDHFFMDVLTYVRQKKALLDSCADESGLFASVEKDKLEYELRSIKRILKEIYEKREKKIIDIALNKSRTRSDIIDTSAMMPEEKAFYKLILEQMDRYREGILYHLLQGQLPSAALLDRQIAPKATGEEPEMVPNPKTEEKKEEPAAASQELVKVKFIHPVPRFIWKDMKEYGPFKMGEETEIFPEIAALLERKGRAQKV